MRTKFAGAELLQRGGDQNNGEKHEAEWMYGVLRT